MIFIINLGNGNYIHTIMVSRRNWSIVVLLMKAVRQYPFEPTRRTSIVHVEDSADDSDIEEHESPPPVSRLGHTLWCSCAQCIPQATERECVCCRELEDVLSIFSQESVRLTCIVDHPEFATVCLNPLVLCVIE